MQKKKKKRERERERERNIIYNRRATTKKIDVIINEGVALTV
jgi:hypothetical protein